MTFERMSETLPPLPAIAKQLEELREGLTRAGVPEKFWRYALSKDPRLDGIRAYNRSVDYYNRLSPDDRKRGERFCTPLPDPPT